MTIDWQLLVDNMLSGSVAAMARLITHVENREPGWMDAMQLVFSRSGRAHVVGITGFGGVGKSSIASRIAVNLAEKGKAVGIIAIDPTSPFSGGALLGDRIRMTDVHSMERVFIRSMATKGALGGLNRSVRDVIKIMGAFGKDYVIVETVGAGQNDVDVARVADIVLLLCAPGQGDAIQCIKAGIMEIADIFVVNKADLDGAESIVADIEDMLQQDRRSGQPGPSVIQASARTGKGISRIVDQIEKRIGSSTFQNDQLQKTMMEDIVSILNERITELVKQYLFEDRDVNEILEGVSTGRTDPYSIADEIMAKFGGDDKSA